MGWIYDGLEYEGLQRQYTDRELLRRVIKALQPFRKAFFLIFVSVIASTIINLAIPFVLGEVIDGLEKNSVNQRVILLSILYLGLFIASFLGYYLINYGLAKMVPGFMVNLRVGVFSKIQAQDLKFFDKNRSGRLTSRVGSDAAETGNVIMLLATFAGNLLLIGTTYFILFSISKELALYILFVLPLVIIATLVFRKLARSLSKTYRKQIAAVNAAIAESIEGIQIAKSYGRERETVDKFQEVNDNEYRAGIRQGATMESIFPTMDLFFVLGVYVIIQVGGLWAVEGINSLNAASLVVFVLYLERFFFPLMQLSTFYSQLQAGFAAYERILEVEDSVIEVQTNPDGDIIDDFKGDIQFKNVYFEYLPDEPVLLNFNLHIKPGEKLAIVGHTGAGKSTISNIIARFYEFQGGTVEVDGRDIRSLQLKEYRKNLGIVQQDPFLFSGTVRENILYGNHDATEEELHQAIHAVHAHEFIEYLPDGLDTEVGERGSRLSTGQRQLVCFARAILANPRILILDEATASIDAFTEAVIQEALEVLFENRTSIIIAHRLSTIVNADRIIVLEKGKIIEEGSHQELMQKGGNYQALYETYFKHQALDTEEETLLNN